MSGHERAAALAVKLRGVYAVVEPERRPLEPFVGELIAGGVRLFQVRAKTGLDRRALTRVVALVRAAGGLTIVNDDAEAALIADGVHLGQEDAAPLDLAELRGRLGSRIIGLSCGTPAQARAVAAGIVDYIGVGPMFATGSKSDAGPPIGPHGVRAVASATTLPTAAIGGIDCVRIAQVRSTGAVMAAVISALYVEADAAATARALIAGWEA